jgi:hypothetical protein
VSSVVFVVCVAFADELVCSDRRSVDVYRRLLAFLPVVGEIAKNKDVVLSFVHQMNLSRTADRSNFRTTSEAAVTAAIKMYHSFDLALIPKASRGINSDHICRLFLPPGIANTAEYVNRLTWYLSADMG